MTNPGNDGGKDNMKLCGTHGGYSGGYENCPNCCQESAASNTVKLPRFQDYLDEKLKDPTFKAGYDAWGDAIETEIKPRDEQIASLQSEIESQKHCYKLLEEHRALIQADLETERRINAELREGYDRQFKDRVIPNLQKKIADLEKCKTDMVRHCETYHKELEQNLSFVQKELDAAIAKAIVLEGLYYKAHKKVCEHKPGFDCEIEVDDLIERLLSERKKASDARVGE